MPCKKSELIAAINSYAAARVSGDVPLINAAALMLQPLIETLDYAPEGDITPQQPALDEPTPVTTDA